MRPISAGLRVTLMPHASIRCFWFRPPVHCTGLTFAPLTLASTEARLQDALQHAAHLRRIARDLDAARFHHLELLLRGAFAAGDDGPGVPHPLARRRSDTGDEADDG